MVNTLKSINKKLVIALIVIAMSGLAMLVKPADAYAGVLFGPESNGRDGLQVYELERGEICLDTKNPVWSGPGTIEGNRDTRTFSAKNPTSDYVKNIHLDCTLGVGDNLRVCYTSHSPHFGNVNFKFTIEAVNREGEVTSVWEDEDWKIRNEEDTLQMNSWDFKSGNKHDGDPFHEYDGVFHLVKIEVWD